MYFAAHLSACFVKTCKLSNNRRISIVNGKYVGFCNQPKAHFGLHGYAPGTIAVNVICTERGFNAGQTHRSVYSLRAIARYWPKIVTFSYCLAFNAPVGCCHWNSGKKFDPHKTRIMGLPGSEDSLTIGWAVSTQFQRVTDRRTDRQTSSLYQ